MEIGAAGARKEPPLEIQIKTRVRPDGILDLHIPTEWAETEVAVKLTIEPTIKGSQAESLESLGWPLGFFERTFGSMKEEPLWRESQGEYEIREEIS